METVEEYVVLHLGSPKTNFVFQDLLRNNEEGWLCEKLEWHSFCHLLSDEIANDDGFYDWFGPDRYCIWHANPIEQGFAFLEHGQGTGSPYILIKCLLVDQTCRKRGYARTLINAMKKYFGERQNHIHVEAREGSKEFWAKLGFEAYDFNQDKYPNRMWLRTWDRKKLLTAMINKEKNNS